MKTVSKNHPLLFSTASVLALLLAGLGYPTSNANAADQPGLTAPPVAAPSMDIPPQAGDLPALPGSANHSKNLGPLEDKVSDSIKNVVKQLGSTDNVNLEDLNTARQAIAKLEVLIDIEKRLNELEKLRSERNGEKNLASAIPASALAAPPPPVPVQKMPQAMEMPVSPVSMPVFSRPDVSRIIGADGHYAAVVQGKTLHVSDNFPDGSQIISISARTVETKAKDGSIHQMHVKGVDEIYGHGL